MSPRDLSAQAVISRLALMHELLADLDPVGTPDAHALERDRLRRRAVERILTQLVDLATDVNNRRDPHIASTQSGRVVGDYRESFDAVVEVGALSAELATHLKPSMGPGTF